MAGSMSREIEGVFALAVKGVCVDVAPRHPLRCQLSLQRLHHGRRSSDVGLEAVERGDVLQHSGAHEPRAPRARAGRVGERDLDREAWVAARELTQAGLEVNVALVAHPEVKSYLASGIAVQRGFDDGLD